MSASEIDADVTAALAAAGLEGEEAAPISALPLPPAARATFRVRLVGGGIVKARRASRPERARRTEHLAAAASAWGIRLPRILARVERVTIEEWIDGTSLADLEPTSARLERAADLLAALHGVRTAGAVPIPEADDVAPALADALERLERIAALGTVSAAEADRLRTGLRRGAPSRAAFGLVHGDFAAGNLLEDRDGDIRTVDLGGLRLGFLDLDLAKARLRWPLAAAPERTFLARYRRSRADALPTSAESFWLGVAAVRSAHFRAARDLPGARRAIERLCTRLGPLQPPRPSDREPV